MRKRLLLRHRRYVLVLLAAFVAVLTGVLHASASCDPRADGAKGDGKTKDTVAIQAAIDDCERQGGGTVRLAAGTYLSAPIELKSNVTLQLDKGAVLLGSSDHGDYKARNEFNLPDLQPLVSAIHAVNVAITGDGVIDGAGESWWLEARSIKDHGILGNGHPRPKLIIFDHCKHVLVEGVTVQNSPMWQVVPYYSDDVIIRNIRVLAPAHSPNTDAVDPFSSSHVIIDHLYADVGMTISRSSPGPINSPGPDDPSRDITITDCTFLHGHGLSIGSEIAGGAQNIRAERIHFEGTDNGIAIKANRDRGNDVGNLLFRNIEMKNVKNALIISEYYPKVCCHLTERRAQPTTRVDATLSRHHILRTYGHRKRIGGSDRGTSRSADYNVVLHNVRISAHKGMTIGYADVTGEGVTVQAEDGQPITSLAGAKVSLR